MNRFAFTALFLFHSVIPAICILLYGAAPYWLLGNLLFCWAFMESLKPAPGRASVLAHALASVAWAILTLMLGISFYMQGTGFNDQFIYHLGLDSLAVAFQAYGGVLVPGLGYVLLAAAAPQLILKARHPARTRRLPAAALWVVAAFANYPLYSFVGYQFELGQDAAIPSLPEELQESVKPAAVRHGDEAGSALRASQDPGQAIAVGQGASMAAQSLAAEGNGSPAAPGRKKNVILLYAEGLEQLYFEQEIFGDLLPRLAKLSRRAQFFTNVYQARGTGWTIAGIVASQCGFPLVVSNHLANNSSMAAVENPYADEQCLGDILQANGYETVYMGGASLQFAGKGNFLRSHGYRKVLGREALQARLEDPDYVAGFGLFDDSLFEMALRELSELERSGAPYLLTLLTLDSHHPNGRPSGSCRPLPGNDEPMSNAIYCSDQLISGFVEQAMDIVDLRDTIIVLMSDHLSLRNTLWDTIQQHRQKRRLMLMLFDDGPPREIGLAMTHFDVAPTILQAVGFADMTTLAMGTSAFTRSGEQAARTAPKIDESGAPSLLLTEDSARDAGIMISRKELTFEVGGFEINASDAGRDIDSGLFLLVLNAQGNVTDTIFTRDSEAMLEALAGRFVVGVSLFGAEHYQGDQYFFGWMSQKPGDLTIRPFDANVHISPVHIMASMDSRPQ